MTVALSIVVPTYGRTQTLQRLLAAIAVQTERPLEVIVVDQNPSGFLALPAGVVHVRMDEPNLSAARNLGFALAHGTHVLFLDDDEVPQPDFVERVTRTFTTHPEVRCLWPVVHAVGREAAALRFWKRRATGQKIAGTPLFRIRRAGGGGIAFEREFFRRTGGYDELLFRFGGGSEDWELASRMRMRGLPVWCDASLLLLHDAAAAGGCSVRSMAYEEARSRAVRACAFRQRIASGPPFRIRLRDVFPMIRVALLSSLGRPDARREVVRRPLWHLKVLRRGIETSRLVVHENAGRYADPRSVDHLASATRQLSNPATAVTAGR